MWSENARGGTMSVAGCTRQEKMPNAWRGSGQRSSFREAQRQLPARPLHFRSQGAAPLASIIDPRCAKNDEITDLRHCMGLMLDFVCPSPPPALSPTSALYERARPSRRCWTSRPDIRLRWPSRLVATAETLAVGLGIDVHRCFPRTRDSRYFEHATFVEFTGRG
jgi:hypothetical protein